MTNIAICYFSGTGHTHLMAEAIAAGTQKSSDVTVQLLRIKGEQIVNGRWKDAEMLASLDSADAIVFGSPTYMGGVAGQCHLSMLLARFGSNKAGKTRLREDLRTQHRLVAISKEHCCTWRLTHPNIR
ncbi:MAG: flavodoxin family protein [Pseudanabaena sp.]|jgi:flavorubredoxin